MTRAPLTIGVVAGEPSGDLLGSRLITALRDRVPRARFIGIGGPRMQAAGMEVLYPLEKLAVRGYVEVLRHYLEIVGMRRRLAAHFLRERPALFIGVDAPDFNLDLEAQLKSSGIPTVHYVSPQIWAWRAGRIHKIKRAVDRMLVVFPFETALYEQAGVPVTYVGHPLADMLSGFTDRAAMREQLRLPAAAKIITLLPGSRVSEVEHMSGLFVETAAHIAASVPDALFLVPLVSRATKELFEAALYRRDTGELNLTVLFGHAHEAMAAADVVLAASGTATLEAALIGRPMVITYRMPRASWWIMYNRRYQPYAGLPNILAGEFVVPEFLQDEATPENLSQAVVNLLFDATVRRRLEARFAAMAQELRQDNAERTAAALLPLIRTEPAP
ncbi:MAG: lipid-A-disaccharide synthase [Betaproteobacteria bacterium]|nr:lipid-A-disaccharide synthase [Betaproteobacteria bacterium]